MIFQWKDVDSQYDSCEVSFDLNGSQTKDGDKEVTLPFLQGEEFEVPGNEDISEMVIIPDCKEYGGIQYGNIVYSPGDIIIIPKIDSAVMWIVWNDNHDWENGR